MADFGSPVAQNVQPPSLQSLSTLMGLRGQQLQQQQQQQNLDKGAAETQMTQQNAQQRAAVAGVDWSKYDDGTGTISTDKMLGDAGLRKAAGDSFLDVVKQGAAMRGMQLQNKQTLVSLNDGLRNQFGAVVGALRTDPDVIADNPTGRQKVAQAITQFGEAGGPDAMKVAQIYAPVAVHAPQGKLVRGINAIQLQAMDASRQAGAQSPTYANTGSALQQTNPQAAEGSLGGGTGGAPIPTGVAPGQQDTVESDAQGNRYIVSRSPSGAIVGTRPVPGTQGTGGTGSGPVNLPANVTPDQRNALAGEVSTQATQASQAGGIHAINQQIYDLAQQPSTTNKWGALGSKLREYTGVDPLPFSSADDYDSMTKMVAQSNMRMSQAMGVHTDQQSSQVAQASGSQHYSPEALKNVVSVNDAMVKAQQMYASGLSNAIQNKGYGAANDFKTKWGSSFDLGAAEYMAAKDSGSASRLAEVKTKLGLSDPKKAAELAAKIKAMHDVSGMQ